MAFGQSQELGWIEAWSNGYYRVSNYLYYKQDLQNRKILVRIANQQCCSLNSAYTFRNDTGVNNGYGFQTHGGPVVDVNDPVYVPGGSCWIHSGDRPCEMEFNYNDDGSLPDINISTQFIAGIGQYNTPEFDWTTKNIKTLFPSISPIPNPPSIPTNLETSSITSNSARLNWDSVENATSYIVATGLANDDVFYEKTVTDTEYQFGNLVSDTEYKWKVRAKDSYSQLSEYSNVQTFKTLSEQAKLKLNVDGQTKEGKVFVNVNGLKKIVKKIYVNVNGKAKECI